MYIYLCRYIRTNIFFLSMTLKVSELIHAIHLYNNAGLQLEHLRYLHASLHLSVCASVCVCVCRSKSWSLTINFAAWPSVRFAVMFLFLLTKHLNFTYFPPNRELLNYPRRSNCTEFLAHGIPTVLHCVCVCPLSFPIQLQIIQLLSIIVFSRHCIPCLAEFYNKFLPTVGTKNEQWEKTNVKK